MPGLGRDHVPAVVLTKGRLYSNDEMPDKLTATADFSNWVTQITVIDDLVRETRGQPTIFERDLLRRRQVGAGLSLEDLELILQPMVEEAKEAVVSMGDDTPLAILTEQYHGLHHVY